VTDATAAPTARKVRPFLWSVRRELWENPALYMAPAAVAGITLLGAGIGAFLAPGILADAEAVRSISTTNVEAFAAATRKAAHLKDLDAPYNFMAGFVFMTATIVGIFYASSALHSERKDRTILFWKSLPVSDVTTVLAKFFVPIVVLPLVILTLALGGQAVILAWSTLVLLVSGSDLGAYYGQLHFPFMWGAMVRGLIVVALWQAPVVAWLLLVSGWARRVPFLWAIAPWVAIPLVEWMALRTHHAFDFVIGRLAGGYALAFTRGGSGKGPVTSWGHLDLTPLLSPGLWGGILVTAALLAAAVRLRRYRDPI